MVNAAPIHIELGGTPRDVRCALLRVRGWLKKSKSGGGDVDTLEFVLGEVLNNVVEHALFRRAGGRIAMTYDRTEDSWRVLVRDNGDPMPNATLPKGQAPNVDLPLSELPEGGFGLSLVRMLAHDIQYCRANGWNALSFRVDG